MLFQTFLFQYQGSSVSFVSPFGFHAAQISSLYQLIPVRHCQIILASRLVIGSQPIRYTIVSVTTVNFTGVLIARCDSPYGPWTEWSDCSVEEGQGTMIRTRACVVQDCPQPGQYTDVMVCFVKACKCKCPLPNPGKNKKMNIPFIFNVKILILNF